MRSPLATSISLAGPNGTAQLEIRKVAVGQGVLRHWFLNGTHIATENAVGLAVVRIATTLGLSHAQILPMANSFWAWQLNENEVAESAITVAPVVMRPVNMQGSDFPQPMTNVQPQQTPQPVVVAPTVPTKTAIVGGTKIQQVTIFANDRGIVAEWSMSPGSKSSTAWPTTYSTDVIARGLFYLLNGATPSAPAQLNDLVKAITSVR